jgi:hypothetical protein
VAKTLDREQGARATRVGEGRDDACLSITERELEAARRDPRKHTFAKAARKYWRKAAPKR